MKVIILNSAEIKSGLNRQKHAEGLISQLSPTHDGRNTWLMNYGTGEEAVRIRLKKDGNPNLLRWNEVTESLDPVNGTTYNNEMNIANIQNEGWKLVTDHSPDKGIVSFEKDNYYLVWRKHLQMIDIIIKDPSKVEDIYGPEVFRFYTKCEDIVKLRLATSLLHS